MDKAARRIGEKPSTCLEETRSNAPSGSAHAANVIQTKGVWQTPLVEEG